MLKSVFDYVRFRFVHFNKFLRGSENRIQTLLVMHCPLNAYLICKQMLVEMKKKCKFDLFVVFHSFLYVTSWLWRLRRHSANPGEWVRIPEEESAL